MRKKQPFKYILITIYFVSYDFELFSNRLKNGPTNLQDLVTDLNAKKRKRRTSFTPQALERLNDAFELNTHPSGVDMSALAQQLNYDREVIRVWYVIVSLIAFPLILIHLFIL